MKKGFTLIELLAVIVILAVIALITVPMILNVVEESRVAAFKDSMYSAFNAVEYYVLEKGLGDVPESGIEAEFLNLKNNSFTSGRFIKNIDGNLIAEFVSDGRYCATGSLINLNVSKGECEINSPSVVIAVNGKEATITLTDDNGIVAYAFTTSSDEPTEWLNVVETTSITETKTAEVAGTYYIHVKNKYGKVTTKEYVIEQNAFCSYQPGDVVGTFEYTGSPEEFIVPCSGTYKLEVYGAQGGNTQASIGGKGGYSYGNVSLAKANTIYVVVGGQGIASEPQNGVGGKILDGGYNGGGQGASANITSSSAGYGGSGGGATHIGTFNNTLELHGSTSGLYIVAGGGGGATAKFGWYGTNYSFKHEGWSGGTGGGITGGTGAGTYNGTGGTQTLGGTGADGAGNFGIGGGVNVSLNSSSGGGGGLYGGGGGYITGGAGGGSGYIDGVTDGATENGVREGNGYAQITLVSIN